MLKKLAYIILFIWKKIFDSQQSMGQYPVYHNFLYKLARDDKFLKSQYTSNGLNWIHYRKQKVSWSSKMSQPRKQIAMDQVWFVIMRTVSNAFKHTKSHIWKLRRQGREILTDRSINGRERILIAPKNKNRYGNSWHQCHWVRPWWPCHNWNKSIECPFITCWSSDNLKVSMRKRKFWVDVLLNLQVIYMKNPCYLYKVFIHGFLVSINRQ